MSGSPSPTLALSLLILLAIGCDSNPSTTEAPPEPAGADAANVDEESIYEVDEEDRYKIFNGTFFDYAPGQPIAIARERLREGKLETGEGTFEVYYIDGRDREELGYLMPDPNDETKVGDITITSENAITEQGARVGWTYGELTQRLGPLEVHGSEIEGQTHATQGRLKYLLDEQHYGYDLGEERVADGAKVVAVVIGR